MKNNHNGIMSSDLATALILTLFGTFSMALSYTLWKKAHIRVMNTNKSAYADPFWLMGFLSLCVGSIFNLLALGYGS